MCSAAKKLEHYLCTLCQEVKNVVVKRYRKITKQRLVFSVCNIVNILSTLSV